MLSEMWPYYDRGMCSVIKATIEPIIEYYRPPVFKKIFFEELTFGEAPIRVEGKSGHWDKQSVACDQAGLCALTSDMYLSKCMKSQSVRKSADK